MQRAILFSLLLALGPGCKPRTTPTPDPQPSPSSGAARLEVGSASASAVSSAAAPPGGLLPVRQGSTIARSPEDDLLYVADEDHKALRVLSLPLDAEHVTAIELPGAPAQVLPTSTSVLVTIRDPGLLLVMKREGQTLVEKGRIKLPADAWGVAISPDEKRAVVTSAWTHQVSVVDLETLAVIGRVDVRREPRGVLIENDGKTAWVSHLVGSPLTRIDNVDGAPDGKVVPLAPSPLRAPYGKVLDASLGYSLVASPDGRRLYAPRHALGAQGVRNWYGAPTVDVLELPSQRSPIPARRSSFHGRTGDSFKQTSQMHGPIVFVEPGDMVQPRGVVYRRSSRTLLVAAEGTDSLVEVDADSPEPGLMWRKPYALGEEKDIPLAINEKCAAPSGVALSRDEDTAYVFCRASYDVLSVGLVQAHRVMVRLAPDPLGDKVARGRRMFYGVGDVGTSGGLACAGCHPEGRDDGHTWHEVKSPESGQSIFVAEAHAIGIHQEKPSGLPRQTQMLAGRLGDPGPYGWHAQAPTLEARAKEGFALHRWDGAGPADLDNATSRLRARTLAPFLREGLVTPPREARPLTDEEERGRKLFLSDATACASCHLPDKGYTNRVAYPLKALATRPSFADEEDLSFKTPGLSFVGGTAPYYHDGSIPTLELLIDLNNDRMGHTSHLTRADRAALVAFLKTL
jgi:DNA-binding beta-propeller fold protein YncE/mono/diheme cytochrome c family protein